MIPSIKFPIILQFMILTACSILFTSTGLSARKLTHKSGKVAFKLHAPMGDIHAANEAIAGFLNTETGQLSYQVTVSGFRFITEQVPEEINKTTTARFNDYYLETEKYPDAVFDGKIINLKDVSFTKDGVYPVQVKGQLTIHGERKDISEWSVLEVKGSNVIFKSDFVLTLSDYKLRVPELVKNVFFKEVEVAVECHLQ